jgi:hypothetical protein
MKIFAPGSKREEKYFEKSIGFPEAGWSYNVTLR